MTDRVLDFSMEPTHLSIRNSLLIVEVEEEERAAIPCEEIAAVLIAHQHVTMTRAVLTGLAKAGAMFVACDEKSMPAAMLLPLDGHHIQAERFRRQAALGLPKKKRLWQSLVRAKIRAQAAALEDLTGSDEGLRVLSARVGSGDPQNVEARAARRYWSRLFGDSHFFRGNPEDPRNGLLNYGYAVLRAATARAICGAGLHPSFCLYHANVHNPFGLADDLMEPFRPIVDRAVVRIAHDGCADGSVNLNPARKRALIAAVLARIEEERESRTLTEVLARVAGSLAAVVLGEAKRLWLPEWKPISQAQERPGR